jgi:LacI family transcriptional regulator
MTPKKAITLKDIAEELDLSKVSVSKALRDHPDIGPETKQLVRETAERLQLRSKPSIRQRLITNMKLL